MSPTIEVNVPGFGALLGSVDEERQVAVFRNVPYAVVPERWRPAVKPRNWSGLRDCTKQGPVCPQLASKYPLGLIVPQEFLKVGEGKHQYGLDHDEIDCLNLNIFVPMDSLKVGAKPVPVMTWLHGGAFRDGSNGVILYNASNMVKKSVELNQPVIIVTVNYRLNVFGFLASRELEQDMKEYVASSPEPVSEYNQSIGNWGLMDQKLAFEWVRENITVFGGNSRNVTAFGESAGSISIHYHLLCPSHHGLFDHAIMQSGTAATMTPGHVHTDGQAVFDQILKNLNIPLELDGPEKIRRLRATPADEIMNAGGEAVGLGYRPHYDDGKIIPSKISMKILSMDPSVYDPNLKSVFIGANKDEGSVFASMLGDRTMATWPGIFQMFSPSPALAPLFEAVYGVPKTDEDVVRISASVTGDSMFMYPVYKAHQVFLERQKQASTEFRVVRYHFDAEIEKLTTMFPGLGSLHAGELPFVFGPPAIETVLTEKELALSSEMQRFWIGFANQIPLSIDEQVPEAEKVEALVFTEGYDVKFGEGVRFTKEGLEFWGKVDGFLAQKDNALLQEREA
ncbi:hypothetical protein BGZ83_011510 [Gryganskiella cystojenkinii]|nr:hypothetical protein BGZ83_011510 [Gryganskiella cystojenkinii]